MARTIFIAFLEPNTVITNLSSSLNNIVKTFFYHYILAWPQIGRTLNITKYMYNKAYKKQFQENI